jgi:CBS domain-containing protein
MRSLRKKIPIKKKLPFFKKKLQVADVMTTDLATVSPEATLQEASKKMKEYRVGNVLVTKNGKLVGIITESDIVRKAVAKAKSSKTKVKSIMSSPVKYVAPDEDIMHVSDKILLNNITRLPVIDIKNKKLVGIITAKDILSVVPDFLQSKIEWLRIHPGGKAKEKVRIKGICEVCGKKTENLIFSDSLWVCEDCE